MSLTHSIAAGLVLLLALVGAQVVALGVTRVLGEIMISLPPEVSSQPWPWIVITVAAVGAAVAFLQGALPSGMKLLKRIG